jgi:hypothetical protein
MPRPRIDLNIYRNEIERRITQKYTYPQILSWLAGKGIIISKNTFSSRIMDWDASRRTRTTGTNTTLIKVVEIVFYTINYNN